jgi:hypothetical protein
VRFFQCRLVVVSNLKRYKVAFESAYVCLELIEILKSTVGQWYLKGVKIRPSKLSASLCIAGPNQAACKATKAE